MINLASSPYSHPRTARADNPQVSIVAETLRRIQTYRDAKNYAMADMLRNDLQSEGWRIDLNVNEPEADGRVNWVGNERTIIIVAAGARAVIRHRLVVIR